MLRNVLKRSIKYSVSLRYYAAVSVRTEACTQIRKMTSCNWLGGTASRSSCMGVPGLGRAGGESREQL